MEKLYPIAKVTRVSGLNGEVNVSPLCRYFDDYRDRPSFFLGHSDENAREVKLEKSAGIGKKIRFLFEGIQTRDEAESLVGQKVFAAASEKDPISMVAPELIGFSVESEKGENLGVLKDILWLPANDVYAVENGQHEFLIPVIPEVVCSVDHVTGRIVIHPMDGLV